MEIDKLTIFLLGLSICMNSAVVAQTQPSQEKSDKEAFYIRVGERAPSELQENAFPYVTRQALTTEDQKTKTYYDLKHYFKEHKWIAVILNYHGYFNEKVQRYEEIVDEQSLKEKLSVLLSSLPTGSYRGTVKPMATPSTVLDITKDALDVLYNNNKVTAWYIDRELSSF